MGSLWCKLWNFFLQMFTNVVNAIAYAIKTVGTVAIELASDLIKTASSAIGGLLGSPVSLLLLGVGAYFLFARKEDDPRDRVQVSAAPQASPLGGV